MSLYLQELNPGVHQHVCTYLQHHGVWSQLEFWRQALHAAVQAELVRVYTEMEFIMKQVPPQRLARIHENGMELELDAIILFSGVL